MSEEVKLNLSRIGLAVGILSGLSALFGAFVLLPYRITAAEQQIRQLEIEARADHELLVRIDERTARTDAAISKIEARLK